MTGEGKAARQSLPISVRNVVKAYGPLRALDDMSIDVRAGEFMTLLGPLGLRQDDTPDGPRGLRKSRVRQHSLW